MAIGASQELDAFSRFVVDRLDGRDLSLEECLAAYRVYETQLAECKADIAPAIRALDAGQGTPLDMDAIIAKGQAILASEGIAV